MNNSNSRRGLEEKSFTLLTEQAFFNLCCLMKPVSNIYLICLELVLYILRAFLSMASLNMNNYICKYTY